MLITNDFFKFQIYQKNEIILKLLEKEINFNDYTKTLLKQNSILKDYLLTLDNYPISTFINNEELKIIIKIIINNDLTKNFYCEGEGKFEQIMYKFIIYPEKNHHFEFEKYFSEENIRIICIGNGISDRNLKKVDYTYLSMGLFNYSLTLNQTIFKRFKTCINIGYNTSSVNDYIGISFGVPFYNALYPIFDIKNRTINYGDIETMSQSFYPFDTIEKEKIDYNLNYYHNLFKKNKVVKKIETNYYLLNLIPYLVKTSHHLLKYDTENYLTIQDMRDYIKNYFYATENSDVNFNIYDQKNGYILIDQKSFDYYSLLYFQKVFSETFSYYLNNLNLNVANEEKIQRLFNKINLSTFVKSPETVSYKDKEKETVKDYLINSLMADKIRNNEREKQLSDMSMKKL